MALTGPGFVSGGRLQEMVSLIDIPPTLLDACNIPVPDDMQGRSVLPLTRGEREDWPKEVYIEICESYLSRAVRTRRWKYNVRKAERGRDRGTSWKFEEDCLYDMMADPYELDNLIGNASYRKVADVMKERLVRRMQEADEPVPEIIDAEERRGGQRRILEEEVYQ